MRPLADLWISSDNDRGPVNRSIPSVSVPWINHLPNSCNLKYQNFISCCFARFTWISTKPPNLHSENDEVALLCYYLNSIAAWIFTHINICHQGQTQHSAHSRRQSDCSGIIRWPQTLSGGAGNLRSVGHSRCLVGYDNTEWQIVTCTSRNQLKLVPPAPRWLLLNSEKQTNKQTWRWMFQLNICTCAGSSTVA